MRDGWFPLTRSFDVIDHEHLCGGPRADSSFRPSCPVKPVSSTTAHAADFFVEHATRHR